MPPGMKFTVLSKDQIEQFLKSQRIGVLAINDGKNSYAVPLAYLYDKDAIYLTLGKTGRKTAYLEKNQNVSFTVYLLEPSAGAPEGMGYTSVICDGVMSRIKDSEELRERGKASEKAMGLPPGALNGRIEKILEDPDNSIFWKVSLHDMGGVKAE